MDWITLTLMASMAALAATLLACLRALAALRAGTPSALEPERFVVVVPGGTPQGPIDRATLRAMLIDGRLDELALAAPVTGNGWRPVAELVRAEDDVAATPGPADLAANHNPWRR